MANVIVISARRLFAVALLASATVISHASAAPDAASTAAMVAEVSPAVVRVITIRPGRPAEQKPNANAANANAKTETETNSSFGSGFIVDPSGYIGTNAHVVDGAMRVFVVTAGGARYPARIVGMPAKADMALLRIDAARELPFVHFGDSDKLRVGDEVIAIGSPFGFDNTVTSGIVSALNRDIMESPFDDYIQTDAAINHGNSGGPLFNMAGEVIGMNSVIYAPTSGSAGVGFAVPSNSLRFVFERLMKNGKINAGMLPIYTQQVDWMLEQALGAPDQSGALVTSVQDDGDKMLRGKIKAGDIIRTFNGAKVEDPRDLARKSARSAVGDDAVLELCRAGVIEPVHVTIQAWPDAKLPIIDNEGPRSLGLSLVSARGEDGEPAVLVASIDPTGSAADSGIQKGDIVVRVQQTNVTAPDQVPSLIAEAPSAARHFAAVLVRRGNKLLWVAVRVPG